MDNASETSHSSPETTLQSQARKPSRADRPCDTCRKRKSRCVKEPNQDKCVLCSFHQRDCTYLDEPQRRKKRGLDGIDNDPLPRRDPPAGEEPQSRKKPRHTSTREDSAGQLGYMSNGKSLLDRTLGLHRTTHFKYIGPGSLHEGVLLELIHMSQNKGTRDNGSKFRRVGDQTTFLSRPDSQTLFSGEDEEDLEAIEQIVRPHGPGLVDLYFRTVHPSYPVLHKGVFLEKYARSYKEFSPPLLAAVYLLAMDWWEYDHDLSTKDKPDGDTLVKAATKALTAVIHRPKLSTIQAGLLLLQRSGGDSWVLTSQIVAVGEELGLHVDCSTWNIPDWEKGLRRRLAWAIIMQDKWGALIHGRPSHVLHSNWRMPRVSLDDFPESGADQDEKEGSTEVEKGRLLFIHLTRLTEIMAEALETLYGPDQTWNEEILARNGIQGLLELVKPIIVKLKEWASEMPIGLRMEDIKIRKLCSNGYLHLSYFVTEIMVYRFIVRNLTPDTPQHLRDVCREAGKARLEHAMNFLETLRPEHLQGFWWFASPKSLAYIRTYGGLLWATSSTDEEAEFYRQKLDDFRWSLKVRAKGVGFVTTALREMEESLQDLDMSQSPVGRRLDRPIQTETHQPAPDMLSNISQLGTAGIESSLEVTPHDHFSLLPNTPDFGLLDLDAAASHSFFANIGAQDLFFSGAQQP